MKHKNSTRPSSSKNAGHYKVTNWKEYNSSLIRRGDITLWFSPNAKLMFTSNKKKKKRGGQLQYTHLYIEICCMIRKLYNLAFRQTQGTISSIIRLSRVTVGIPCYTQICRRMKSLKIHADIKKRHKQGESIHIVVDSTGAKVYGEGEWKVRQHGWGKHRTWRKIHLGINPDTGEILCHELTTNSIHDADMAEPLLQQVSPKIKIRSMLGDGGYDKSKVYKTLEKRKIIPIIPPQKNARIIRHGNYPGKPHARDKNLRYIRKHGRVKWKRQMQYHKRSLVETTMFRFKTTFSGQLRSRTIERQKVEVAIACKMLNRMVQCGMPETEKITLKAA